MDIFEQESLQEALQELRQSKERELRLAEENQAILATILAISNAENRHQIFNELLIVLRKYIRFDDALVLMKTDNKSSFSTFLSTNRAYEDIVWEEEDKFSRALDGECILLYEPRELHEFKHLKHIAKEELQSALVTGINTEISQSLIIFIAKEKGKITIKSKNTLQRFRPLIERAVIDIDHKERLQSLVMLRTNELLKNRQRFHDFANSVGDWLWETDENLNFTYRSNSNMHSLSIKDNNLKASLNFCCCHSKLIDSLTNQEPFRDIEVCIRDGNWISISGRPYHSETGKFLGYRGSAKDITGKIKRLSELKKARQEALDASKAKSEFLAMMSHEIRTPLNTVLGLLDVLQVSSIAKKHHQLLQKMESSAELLLAIISDILELSRIESGQFALHNQQSCLKDIVTNSVHHFLSHAEKKNIQLEARLADDLPESIWIDPTRISQILFNIIGNAVKFTSEGQVRIHVYQKGMKLLYIEVIDTGIGIKDSIISVLFQPFKQADSTITRKFGGTGLGLAITKRLLDLMGGNIEVNSVVGEGSTFLLTIPIIESDHLPVVQVQPTTELVNLSKKILVAEDSKTNQMVIKLMLDKLGHQVLLADNGFQAINILKQSNADIDMVFMDLSMPVLDGLSATIKIREEGFTLPIVALTAHAMDTDREKCMQSGMNAFITKPVRIKELQKTIEQVT